MSSTLFSSNRKAGTLTIAGSGIASIAHITLGTLSFIKSAEKIFYIVCDPITETYIKDNATGTCFNLTIYYDKEKSRYDSYVQMCEVMLRDVRAGYDVLGIFYGHPGVFVSPSHRAIAIAREEGYSATMLPGISTEDYLFADLGVDPAHQGCKTSEATELIVQDRSLDPTVHNIIWQVGGVGVKSMEFNNEKFHILVDRLEKYFGLDHRVVHYQGAVLPQSKTVKDIFKISDLRKDDVIKQFNTISTFYIPPLALTKASTFTPDPLGWERFKSPKSSILGEKLKEPYGPIERAAIALLDNHVVPDEHRSACCTPAAQKFMVDLALNPKKLLEYKTNPTAAVELAEGLSAKEKAAFATGTFNSVLGLLTATKAEIDSGRVSLGQVSQNDLMLAVVVIAIC